MEVVHIEGLEMSFGDGDNVVNVLKDINLTLVGGELMALLGPSGSGKTTLLLCMSMILEPQKGKVVINGQTITDNGFIPGIDQRRFRRENIGFIFQGHNLVPFLTALDNVILAMELTGVNRTEAKKRALDLLHYLEIGHRANAMAPKLSGGERQRVAIARALANNAKLILADEPTASLDTERGFSVVELLKRIAKERDAAVVVVTHDERMIQGFDTVQRMNDGRLGENEA